ncbi:MAG: hypothetical protein RIR53_1614 [Bacteroidota bacterium]|jgi:hypothetical protein
MTPNETQSELREQLSNDGMESETVLSLLSAHKSRRDASVETATSQMSMRVHRQLSESSVASTKRRLAPMAFALSMTTAAVVLFISFGAGERSTTELADTVVANTRTAALPQSDVDGLVDALVRRNTASPSGWIITESDVDLLLGEDDVDLSAN